MKITKRQLRRIIKEEKRKLLSEQASAWGSGANPNILADYSILDFARAWSTLGPEVQEQVLALLEAYGAGGHRPTWEDAIDAQDPAAIRQAMDTLGPSLKKMQDFDEGFDIYSALKDALEMYEEEKNPSPPGPKISNVIGDE
jgi:hypothetical protein